MPIVSILLPTYKNPAYILRAIDSVIKQSYEDWELLIIDDGLTETARGIISDFIKQEYTHKYLQMSNDANKIEK